MKKKQPSRGKSPGFHLIERVYYGAKVPSRRDRHKALRHALDATIVGHLSFHEKDFTRATDELFIRDCADLENVYGEACKAGNRSACRSLEAYFDRPPFICEGHRLYVGARARWEGRRVKVTGFGKDHNGPFVRFCTEGAPPDTQRKLFKVTRDELKTKQPKKDKPKVDKLLIRFLGLNLRDFGYFDHKKALACGTFGAFWAQWDEKYAMANLLAELDFPITLKQAKDAKDASDLRALVGDFETNLRPRLESWVHQKFKEHRAQQKADREAKAKERP